MRTTALFVVAAALLVGSVRAQENKPVPKDSRRVAIPGCAKGYIFTTGPRTEDQPRRFDIPEGIHLRMNGPKALMAEIHAHEGSMIEITGLMKKDQFRPDGVGIGGGVRVSPGPPGGGLSAAPAASQNFIDVEAWRALPDGCPSR
jgi:hypothetical protein